jgi:hypothetical protein
MRKKTIGRGRTIAFTEYQLDPRDIFGAPRHRPPRPVSVTYYKPTREQHYAAMGHIFGVERKPTQSLRSYARAVEKVIAAAEKASREQEDK